MILLESHCLRETFLQESKFENIIYEVLEG
jgi:hypothetical protein